MQVARALDYVHYRGIVHRDIKPANVMISRAGGVKVMDFGIARDTSFGDLTEAGTGIGTPAYMSPEQVLGDKLDSRSDIFSLGVVLYQMLTGKKPFVEDEKKSAMHKIRLERHTSARSLNTDIPRELERIIDRCLEKQPRDRWRSAQHMVMALERFLAKHVEMNHHARLVLFLRAQNVITDLEAEEYLNPAALGGAAALAQPNMQARYVVRTSMVGHGIILGVLMLMIGFIYVAPVSATPVTDTFVKEIGHGFIRVDARPWANVSIDGKPVGTTPMGDKLELTEGAHTVRFDHDWFQPVEKSIAVEPKAATQLIRVDFCADHVALRAGKVSACK
jgi:serine/threonine-protein kinase